MKIKLSRKPAMQITAPHEGVVINLANDNAILKQGDLICTIRPEVVQKEPEELNTHEQRDTKDSPTFPDSEAKPDEQEAPAKQEPARSPKGVAGNPPRMKLSRWSVLEAFDEAAELATSLRDTRIQLQSLEQATVVNRTQDLITRTKQKLTEAELQLQVAISIAESQMAVAKKFYGLHAVLKESVKSQIQDGSVPQTILLPIEQTLQQPMPKYASYRLC